MRLSLLAVLAIIGCALARPPPPPRIHQTDGASYDIYCLGECDRPHYSKSTPGVLMMGGTQGPDDANDQDKKAYQWFLSRAHGGDVVTLTDYNDDECDYYNPFFWDLEPNVKTFYTICLWNRNASYIPDVYNLVKRAAAIWFTGGDQSEYYLWTKSSPVSKNIQLALARGVPFGGQSAGLAIQGEFMYSALYDTIYSDEALLNPFDERITLANDYLHLRCLQDLLTDSHFMQRDRMGRSIVFLGRILKNGWVREGDHHAKLKEVALSAHTSVLLDQTQCKGTFMGDGPAFMMEANPYNPPDVMEPSTPVQWNHAVHIWKWTPDMDHAYFDFRDWKGHRGGIKYEISVVDGTLVSTQKDGAIY